MTLAFTSVAYSWFFTPQTRGHSSQGRQSALPHLSLGEVPVYSALRKPQHLPRLIVTQPHVIVGSISPFLPRLQAQ